MGVTGGPFPAPEQEPTISMGTKHHFEEVEHAW